MTKHEASIGIFDSGVGGLSVMNEIVKLLPNEDILYYCDNLHAPYGSKSAEEITELSVAITKFLVSKQCKIIVVACNTATTAAIHFLRQSFELPFVGIEPAIKPAALQSATGKVGVLATQGTLHGGHFLHTSERFANGVDLLVQEGDGLVEIVENGETGTQKSVLLLRKYIQPMLDNNIDHLVLGCTHYPFLIGDIQSFIPPSVKIINPAPAVSVQTKRVLAENNLLNPGDSPGHFTFYSSGNSKQLKILANQINHPASVRFISFSKDQ